MTKFGLYPKFQSSIDNNQFILTRCLTSILTFPLFILPLLHQPCYTFRLALPSYFGQGSRSHSALFFTFLFQCLSPVAQYIKSILNQIPYSSKCYSHIQAIINSHLNYLYCKILCTSLLPSHNLTSTKPYKSYFTV